MFQYLFYSGIATFLGVGCVVGGKVAPKKEQEPERKSPIPIVYSPKYKISMFGLEKLHPFDIAKYDKIFAALKKDGFVNKTTVVTPTVLTDEQLKLVHSAAYLKSLNKSTKLARYLEAPSVALVPNGLLESRLIRPFKLASGGTLQAARLALKKGMAVNLGGGYHHAKPTKGEGFCIIADVPIAIKQLQKEKLIKRALIIDTDIHQGNGTILCLDNDKTTYTFSIHEGGIYPTPKEVGDKDVSVKAGITDAEYLKILKAELPKIIAASKPDIVFHVAGCDALKGDPLANGNMTHEGIRKRDAMVVEACKKHKIPYVMTLSGGYSKGAWKSQYLSIKNLIEKELEK